MQIEKNNTSKIIKKIIEYYKIKGIDLIERYKHITNKKFDKDDNNYKRMFWSGVFSMNKFRTNKQGKIQIPFIIENAGNISKDSDYAIIIFRKVQINTNEIIPVNIMNKTNKIIKQQINKNDPKLISTLEKYTKNKLGWHIGYLTLV
jgi:hypothetical protein